MLNGFTAPRSPLGATALVPSPPWHFAGDVLAVEFWNDPDVSVHMLPTGIELDQKHLGHSVALFTDYQFTAQNDEYLDPARYQSRGFSILLDAMWKGARIAWCPYCYVDNDAALMRGWIQGYPRKLGAVHKTRTFASASAASAPLARAFYPEQAKIAQVDVRPEALGNRCSLHLGLLGNVKDTLDAVLPSIREKTDSSHLREALSDYETTRKDLDALAESGPNSNIIHPQYATRLVSELAADDAIFTCDVGTPIIWTARYLKVNGKRRIIGSFNHGSMANAMLQAIGAQATYPDRQVISMSGDGGFSMMMGDFITLTQMGPPVKVIVLNNGTLGFVEMEMRASGFLDAGCDLKNPDFALMAKAMGVRGIRVEKPQELKGAIEAALAHRGPVLVDVVSAGQELAMPPKTTLDQAYHFGMFMMKAVLDGRATQLVDLARVNLLR